MTGAPEFQPLHTCRQPSTDDEELLTSGTVHRTPRKTPPSLLCPTVVRRKSKANSFSFSPCCRFPQCTVQHLVPQVRPFHTPLSSTTGIVEFWRLGAPGGLILPCKSKDSRMSAHTASGRNGDGFHQKLLRHQQRPQKLPHPTLQPG